MTDVDTESEVINQYDKLILTSWKKLKHLPKLTPAEVIEGDYTNKSLLIIFYCQDKIIDFDYDIEAKTNLENDLLQLACYQGYCQVTKYLIDTYQWDINTATKSDISCYSLAAGQGRLEILKLLETYPTLNIMQRSKRGLDAYHRAIFSGHLHILKYLENKHHWDINSPTFEQTTPFILACMHGQLEIVKYLASHPKCNIFHQNQDKIDGYLIALSNHHLDIIQYLDNTHQFFSKKNKRYCEILFKFAKSHKNKNDEIISYISNMYFQKIFHPFSSEVKDNICCICYSPFQDKDKYIKCHQNHSVHQECHFQWLIKSKYQPTPDICVMCKSIIPLLTYQWESSELNTKVKLI